MSHLCTKCWGGCTNYIGVVTVPQLRTVNLYCANNASGLLVGLEVMDVCSDVSLFVHKIPGGLCRKFLTFLWISGGVPIFVFTLMCRMGDFQILAGSHWCQILKNVQNIFSSQGFFSLLP